MFGENYKEGNNKQIITNMSNPSQKLPQRTKNIPIYQTITKKYPKHTKNIPNPQ